MPNKQENPRVKDTITESTQRDIAAYYARHKVSMRQVAEHFKTTLGVVRGAIKKSKEGTLQGKRRTRKDKIVSAKNKAADKSFKLFDEIDKLIKQATAQLEDEGIPATERIPMIEKLIKAKQNLDDHTLQLKMKGFDFPVIHEMIRKYNPDITINECIQEMNEAKARVMINRKHQ